MDTETATAVTDVALSAGTFILGFTVGEQKTYRTWTALFITLALAAALGALYHGVDKFHIPAIWILVSSASVASGFLFLAACLCVTRPQWKWLHWLWPLWGIVGILVGGLISSYPFFYISAASGVCILISMVVLLKAPTKLARNWIYAGIAVTIFGLVVQETTNFEGLLSRNALFHELQLIGNFFLWIGARKS